jgi:peptide/nickel transport system permease protein
VIVFGARRLLWGAVVVLATAVAAFGLMRVLRPERYGGAAVLPGIREDLERAFLHFDLGDACGLPGCPAVSDLVRDGFAADLWLLAGAIAIGVLAGIAGGGWCAARPRTRSARALESLAMVGYCMPVYVAGLGLLLLFAPPFGLWQLPFFFEPHSYAAPTENPWDFVRSLLLPWLVLAMPIAAACLRVTVVMSLDVMHENYIRTAYAKGLPRRTVVRRHAAPAAYVSIAALMGATIPAVVTNLVLVEYVFSVPGVFRHTERAIGQADLPLLQALAMWAAILIVVAGLLSDLVLAALDPRIRTAGRLPG